MSTFTYDMFTYRNVNYNDIYGITKHTEKIKQHLIKIIRNEINNNRRIYINDMLIRIFYDLITSNYSPYTFLDDEYIIEKIEKITLDDIIKKGIQWLDRYKLCRCNPFSCYNRLQENYNREIIYNIMKYYICEYGVIPKCKFLLLSYQYYIQEKKVGSLNEISEYENLLTQIENDPEEFHNKHKYKIPTKNLMNLKYKIMNDKLIKEKQPCCGLCQYDIENLQKYYELPCCHFFHENGEECLENATILFWLKDNNFCPICKQEVIL